jgi:hypothetical protein
MSMGALVGHRAVFRAMSGAGRRVPAAGREQSCFARLNRGHVAAVPSLPPTAVPPASAAGDATVGSALLRAWTWPLPGAGRTRERWAALAALAEQDLVVARLAEAHADALAILVELGVEPGPAGSRWGVWAAEIPGHELTFDPVLGVVAGVKAWCSGATLLTDALVTAAGGQLLAVRLEQPAVVADDDTWAWPGMRAADTRTVRFTAANAAPIGRPGQYLSRPGFWIGGIGVAACWYGGAVALANPLRARRARSEDPHAAAHLGAVDVVLGGARDVLHGAADVVDQSPDGDHARLARRVRATVAQAATEVALRVGRALGPGPYATDPLHAQRVADLEVYVRQDHAERDLAALGRDVAAGAAGWSL